MRHRNRRLRHEQNMRRIREAEETKTRQSEDERTKQPYSAGWNPAVPVAIQKGSLISRAAASIKSLFRRGAV